MGQYNEDTKEIENYDFLGCNAVGNPSADTFAPKEQFKVAVESVEPRQAARIQEQLEDTVPKQYDISEKSGAFREKHIKDGVPSKITREMTADLLTMQRECVEAGHDTQELDALSNEIFGEQAEPRAPPSPKPPDQNSNQDRDLLNRAQRELQATQNLAVHLKDQVTELETSISTTERQLSRHRRVTESLQEQIDAVMREADETQSFQAARLVRKAISAVNDVPATLDELGISKKRRIAAVPEDEIEAAQIGTAGLREENHMHDHWRDKIKVTQPPICFR